MKLIKTEGEVGVENERGKPVDLIANLGLYNGYRIGTQTKSFAWIDLDDTKLTKMDEKSDVDIIKDGKKLELVVNSGSLFFNVTKPLEDDESMNIRTSTTICGIRGTCGWAESHGDTSYIGLFDGTVECFVLADGKAETVKINAKEILIVKRDGDHVTYEVKGLTYKDVPEFVQVEIADEPFALEESSDMDVAFETELSEQESQAQTPDEVDKFLGTYTKLDNGDYIIDLLILEDGRLFCDVGNSAPGGWIMHNFYIEYSINGNELKATSEEGTDTFILNDDGSITATFSVLDFDNGVYEPKDRNR